MANTASDSSPDIDPPITLWILLGRLLAIAAALFFIAYIGYLSFIVLWSSLGLNALTLISGLFLILCIGIIIKTIKTFSTAYTSKL